MKVKAFSVFDSKAEAFAPPFFVATVGLALRGFEDLAADPKTSVYKYPSDFFLYQVGEFDDQTGSLVPCKPVNLGVAKGEKVFELKKDVVN